MEVERRQCIYLNGVLMPVLILNVSIHFLGLCLVPLTSSTTLTGANGVRMKYGNDSLVYPT